MPISVVVVVLAALAQLTLADELTFEKVLQIHNLDAGVPDGTQSKYTCNETCDIVEDVYVLCELCRDKLNCEADSCENVGRVFFVRCSWL